MFPTLTTATSEAISAGFSCFPKPAHIIRSYLLPRCAVCSLMFHCRHQRTLLSVCLAPFERWCPYIFVLFVWFSTSFSQGKHRNTAAQLRSIYCLQGFFFAQMAFALLFVWHDSAPNMVHFARSSWRFQFGCNRAQKSSQRAILEQEFFLFQNFIPAEISQRRIFLFHAFIASEFSTGTNLLVSSFYSCRFLLDHILPLYGFAKQSHFTNLFLTFI